MPKYIITAPNGKTLEVTGDKPPSESDLNDIFAKAGVSSEPMAAAGSEYYPGRKMVSSDSPDSTLDKVNASLEPLAHPQTAGDIGALLIPSGAGALVAKGANAVASGVSKYGGALVEAGMSFLPEKARKAVQVLSALNPAEWNSPLTVAGRENRAHAAVADMVDRYMPNSGGSAAIAKPTQAAGKVPYATPTPPVTPEPKIALKAIDVTRIKGLIGQGLSQSEAVKTVMNLKTKGILQ